MRSSIFPRGSATHETLDEKLNLGECSEATKWRAERNRIETVRPFWLRSGQNRALPKANGGVITQTDAFHKTKKISHKEQNIKSVGTIQKESIPFSFLLWQLQTHNHQSFLQN